MGALPRFALNAAEVAALHPAAEQPGECIGPYRLTRELGQGGMSTVWLAQRIDGLIPRPVALKLPQGIWRRGTLVERFARERQLLAALAHPNIARLYDAGVAASGQPYLALEYVEGRPIDVYCREESLSTRARVALFLQVARAVAYAHGKLIVHRDLKPANILVTAEGDVRLLDFGIAKLLDAESGEAAARTELSQLAFTPDYAPAQTDLSVGLGRTYLALGEPQRALPYLESADAFWREFDADNRWAGEAAAWLGRSLAGVDRASEAREAFERARAILQRSPIPSDAAFLEILR